MRHTNVKTVHMFLRRRHCPPLRGLPRADGVGATGATSGTFLDDEQFEVLESGAMSDEVADDIAAGSRHPS